MENTDELINIFNEDQEKKDNMIEGIISSNDYIEWLYNFTINNGNSFYDTYYNFFPNKVSSEDKANIDKLPYFYDLLDEYAEKYEFYPTQTDFGNYYQIEYKNLVFKIGIMYGQGTIFYCKKSDYRVNSNIISYFDLVNDRRGSGYSNNPDRMVKKVELFDAAVCDLLASGVNEEELHKRINLHAKQRELLLKYTIK